MAATAVSTAKGASRGIDGITSSLAKGVAAGNLFADAIKGALAKAKEWTIGAIQQAGHVSRMTVVTQELAKAHGIAASEAMHWPEAVQCLRSKALPGFARRRLAV